MWRARLDEGRPRDQTVGRVHLHVRRRTGTPTPSSPPRRCNADGGYTHLVPDPRRAAAAPADPDRPGIGGDRVVTDTIYDERRPGRRPATPRTPSRAPVRHPVVGAGVVGPRADPDRVRQRRPGHRDAIFLAGDGVTNLVEKWRTITAYEGDLTKVTPPDGGTPTTTVTDIEGRIVELRQHTTAAGVDGAYRDQQLPVQPQGPAGQGTDHGRQRVDQHVRHQGPAEPDGRPGQGHHHHVDVQRLRRAGQDHRRPRRGALVHLRPARPQEGAPRRLGRPDALRAEWKYDTLYTGQPPGPRASSPRRSATNRPARSNAYKWQVREFTDPLPAHRRQLRHPRRRGPAWPAPGTSATATHPYDGSPTSILYPAGGGLATETVTTDYDPSPACPTELDTNLRPGLHLRRRAAVHRLRRTHHRRSARAPAGSTSRTPPTTTRPPAGSPGPRSAGDRRRHRRPTAPTSYDNAGNIISIAEQPQVGPPTPSASATTSCGG